MIQQENGLLGAALMYARLGLRVFPLRPGEKAPAITGWPEKATTGEAQIRAWWGANPAFNIGLAMGGGMVAVDIDQHGVNGFEALAAYEAERGALPTTWTARTPSGGQHLYFKLGEDVPNRVGLYPGIDVRGQGGYVVAPPSVLGGGGIYRWEKAPGLFLLADADPNVYTFLSPAPERLGGGAAPFSLPEEIAAGQRVNTLIRLVGSLQGKGLGDEAIRAAVLAENEERCTPPLTEDELEREVFPALLRWVKGTAPYCAPGSTFKPGDFSDAGNSAVFVQTFQGNLAFTDSLGWLWWTGQRWERNDHQALALALWLSGKMLTEAKADYRAALQAQAEAQGKYAGSGEEMDGKAAEEATAKAKAAKAYLTWAGKSREANRLQHMLALSKPALVLPADQLDAEPFDLNTPAGIVDLRTGGIRPHDRGAFCTRLTAAAPSGEGAALWADFLEVITCGDPELKRFLQAVAGMAAVGAVYQEGVVLAFGGGRNGKSTFFNALAGVLGDYSGNLDVKTLTTDRTNKGAAMATLRGRRLVITGELEEHQRLSVATLKQLASTDALVIEEKFRQPETVKPSHTLALFTNHLPRVGSTDEGTWRRLIAVPFRATIPADKGIQNFGEKLIREAGGAILSWVIEGAVGFVADGCRLVLPASVQQATADYQARENWLGNFLSERCTLDPDARVGASELYTEYRDWAASTGDFVRRLSDFTGAMETAGFQRVRPKNRAHWVGIRLNLAVKHSSPCAATG